MKTYDVRSFDPARPALYVGSLSPVKAGNVKGALGQVARTVGGHVQDRIVIGPDGLAYDVMIDRGITFQD